MYESAGNCVVATVMPLVGEGLGLRHRIEESN